ncbi:ArsR/SmtB family transcription factor [Anaeromicropila herbilytica]|uniref:Transcriptional regulator n=1 Tax=Anaeromicropila herbilytica TaxID=2785025 RepID=A0A7R7ELN2_9FIRM|nr:winged helix-turn-helix domain-containing protein [Anaeromicropila herbilytica]BCN31181.1 transcriptional regulator [Anaeromicropila herbilytica]
MKITVLNKIDYINESDALLTLIAEDYDFEQLREKLLKRYGIDNEKVQDTYYRVTKIYSYMLKHLAEDMDQIRFYYKNIGEYSDNIASFVLLYDFQNISLSIDEIREKVLNISDSERLKEFSNHLNGFYKIGLTDEESEDITTVDLFRKINNSELKAEDKLLIQQIFLDKKKYLNELLSLIEKTTKLFEYFKEDFDYLGNEFYKYWTDFTTHEDLYDYIAKNVNIVFDKNLLGTYLIPNIFYCNRCSFSSRTKEEREDSQKKDSQLFDVFRIGVLFDKNLTSSSRSNDVNEINQALKLLSDKSKFEILMLIKEKSSYGIELAKSLNLSTPTISYHMSALISQGLVRVEKQNNKVFYISNKERIEEILKQIRRYLVE